MAAIRHVLATADLLTGEIERIFAIAEALKLKLAAGDRPPLLAGRALAMLFEKQSLRTRVSFETGMIQLGGGSLFLGADVGWGSRETIADFGRVLSQYADAIVVRGKSHSRLEELAKYSTCPVINGLTDLAHPCQALADLFTLRELVGPLAGLKLAFVGDGNNVARSLAEGCGKLGMKFALAAPSGYEFSDAFVAELRQHVPRLELEQTTDPVEAVRGAVAVYTDVWASMGQEDESEQRRQDFAAFQVNAKLMRHAADAYFMHCLPARRGEEVTDDVIDSSRSVVVRQAANRMHAQKGLLVWLLNAAGGLDL